MTSSEISELLSMPLSTSPWSKAQGLGKLSRLQRRAANRYERSRPAASSRRREEAGADLRPAIG